MGVTRVWVIPEPLHNQAPNVTLLTVAWGPERVCLLLLKLCVEGGSYVGCCIVWSCFLYVLH